MGYQSCKPSPALASIVKQYWTIQNYQSAHVKYIHRIIPTGLVELMFHFGDLPSCSISSLKYSNPAIVSGQINQFYEVTVTGNLDMISATLQPHALPLLFGIPASEIFNRNIPLNFLLNKKNDLLYNDMYSTSDFQTRVNHIEKFLLNQLKKNYDQFMVKRIESTLLQINRYRGMIDVESLASHACLSRKQYVRSFNNFIGISPKRFLRTVRFQNAIHMLQTGKVNSFTELAYHCGYYDQPHLNNDFRSLSGLTPGEFIDGCKPQSDYFL